MNDKRFDEFVRQQLRHQEAEVPAGMWERIQAEPKRRRPLGWIWWAAGLLALLGGGMFWLLQQDNRATGKTAITLHTVPATDKTLSGHATSAMAADEQHTASEHTTAVLSTDTAAISGATGTAGNTSGIASERKTIRRMETAASGSVGTKHAIKPAGPAQQDIQNGGDAANLGVGYSAIYNKPMTNDNLYAAGKWDNAGNRLFVFRKQLVTKQPLVAQDAMQSQPVAIGCPRFTPPHNFWYLEGYVAGDRILKTQRPNGTETKNDDYVRRKDSTEARRFSFSAGIRVSKKLSDNLLLKAGLQYSQVNEQFLYRQEASRRITTVITVHTVVNAPGDTSRYADTSNLVQVGYRTVSARNTYRFIDLPVLLGYETRLGSFQVGVTAGPVFNLRTWSSGYMLDTVNKVVELDKRITRKSIGVGLYVGCSLIRPLTQRLDVFAEPYLRYNFGTLTNEAQPFSLRTATVGMQLGIRFNLNNGQQ